MDEITPSPEGSSDPVVSSVPPTPPPVPRTAPSAPRTALPDEVRAVIVQHASRMASGARWYYWIAGLSLINSLIAMAQGNLHFIVGLGITEVLDALPKALHFSPFAVLPVNIVIAGIFAVFGYFATKRHNWAFLTGIILYGLDGLLILAFKDYLGFGFHIFALYFIVQGYQANRKLCEIEQQLQAQQQRQQISF